MKKFKDKVVVITGAGSGIGRNLAIEFSKLGAKLALNDYNTDGLEETVGLLKSGTAVFQKVFDVSQKEEMFSFAAAVIEHYGQADVMINNAGVAITRLMADEVSIEDYEWIMGINLWGVMYGSIAFLPHLRRQKESSLVNISSLFGLVGIPGQAPYCMTKFAVRGFTESLHLEEQINKTGVAVSCVHPGGIKTNIAKSARGASKDPNLIKKFEKVLTAPPKMAADTIIKGIRKKKARIIVGKDARAIHAVNQLARPVLLKLLQRSIKKL
ncbi:MAG: SDR family NAD(P)-dependent oxidoreductase [Aureispira sp.]|nr:SDR family NAD(P)-dependent oxidoreductase [Aureispira sp.]